jgi:hypothetical protein
MLCIAMAPPSVEAKLFRKTDPTILALPRLLPGHPIAIAPPRPSTFALFPVNSQFDTNTSDAGPMMNNPTPVEE